MRYTLTIREDDYADLRRWVGSRPHLEGAAYLLCGHSGTTSEYRLLVKAVVPVDDQDYLIREADRLSIGSRSYVSVAKRAEEEGNSVIFVHLHPEDRGIFSAQDDREEPQLMEFLEARIPCVPHGSLVLGADPELSGRIWLGSSWAPLEVVRLLGERFRFVYTGGTDTEEEISPFFDRQVRAFGKDVQRLLARLHVGVVGLGGTGSATAEQLCRLGIGTLSLFDGEVLDPSNLSRVYGSTAEDIERSKAHISARHLEQIGLGTITFPIAKPITQVAASKALRACDIVFGCTDRQAPRGILVSLSIYYLIPVFDVGVKIDSPDGSIRSVDGRLTVLWPGEACLFCRGRISAEIIALESLSPNDQRLRAEEGYAPELETEGPAVIAFTTAIASKAIGEFLHRLTGWMGFNAPSEFRVRFHEDAIGSSSQAPSATCYCSQRNRWGRGDRKRFLDLAWST